jgi:NitT/TauT family transport system substrate-binding protein
MAKTVVKPWVKIAGAVLAVVLVYFGISFLRDSGMVASNEATSEKPVQKSGGLFSSKTPTFTMLVDTYTGHLPIFWLNNGLNANEDCILFKEYGIKLNIKVVDDFISGRAAFKNDDVNIIFNTLDAYPIEMGDNSGMEGAKFFMISNKSRGADAIVVTQHIKNAQDFKGKKIAFAEGTAAHSFLINFLETNSIGIDEIEMVKVDDGIQAAERFNARVADVCITWTAMDAECVKTIPGARVFLSTKQAPNLVVDGFIAKESFLTKNRDYVEKLTSAILWANSKVQHELVSAANTMSKSELKQHPMYEAIRLSAKILGSDEDFCINGIQNIQFSTLGDNMDFFGLNSDYTGYKAEELYSKMVRTYEEVKLVRKPLSWRKVSSTEIIEALEGKVAGNQSSEMAVRFTAPTQETVKAEAISTKKVTINFDTNSSTLSNDARAVIDREFVGIAKQFSGARIRVEGNTDDTGNYDNNVALSKKRAQAVVDYLIREYQFDGNRFVVTGNGPKHARDNAVKGASEEYRRTDFQLLSE